jgi:hypothetical protein
MLQGVENVASSLYQVSCPISISKVSVPLYQAVYWNIKNIPTDDETWTLPDTLYTCVACGKLQ